MGDKIKGLNLKSLRMKNQREVLRLLAREQSCTRVQLAGELGLSKMTISNIINQLIDEDLIEEKRATEDGFNFSTGPKPMDIYIKPNRIMAVGVTIAGSRVLAAITDLVDGRILTTCQIEYDDQDIHIDLLKKVIHQLLRENEEYRDNILGIGIASYGLVDVHAGKVILDHNTAKIYNIKKAIQREFDYPVYIVHVAQAEAMKQLLYGKIVYKDNFYYLSVEEEIYGSLVANGNIYYGNDGYGIEVGHISVKYDGEFCTCGNHGCYRMYASTEVLKQKSKCNSLTEMIEKYKNNDPLTIRTIESFIHVTNVILINLINQYNPMTIIMANKDNMFQNALLQTIQTYINLHSRSGKERTVKLIPIKREESDAVIGAAGVIFEHFFANTHE